MLESARLRLASEKVVFHRQKCKKSWIGFVEAEQ